VKDPLRRGPGRTLRFLKRGLGTVLPIVGTIAILAIAFSAVDRYAVGPINRAIYWSLEHNPVGWNLLSWLGIDPYDEEYIDTDLLPIDLQTALKEKGLTEEGVLEGLRDLRSSNQTFLRDFDTLAVNGKKLHEDVKAKLPPIVGFFFSLLLILWLGSLASGFLGRQVINGIDRSMKAIPLVRSIYPYTKQVVEFFLSEEQLEFDTVVAVPYPSKGLWALGFVTSKAFRSLREATGQDLVSVFIPSSPMPMTGYTIFVPVDRLIPMPFTVDEALRATVSGGVLIPPQEMVPGRAEVALDSPPAPREPE